MASYLTKFVLLFKLNFCFLTFHFPEKNSLTFKISSRKTLCFQLMFFLSILIGIERKNNPQMCVYINLHHFSLLIPYSHLQKSPEK
jgi:hypothetical protein